MKIISLILFVCSLYACGGGGGGAGGGAVPPPPPPPPPPQTILGGTIEAPNGQIALHWAPSGIDRWVEILVPAANASIPGVTPVADGTPVDLIRLDDAGEVIETLASTTTSGGEYSFNFTELGLDFANDLMVIATGGAGVELRAFATQETTNIDPDSEATVSLILEQLVVLPGTTISNFTLQELDDLLVSVRLSTTVNGILAGVDVPSTVNAIRNAAGADPGVGNFFSMAAGPGQASIGPGDIGEFFPFTDGAAWTFDGSLMVDGSQTGDFTNRMFVDGTRDVNGTVVTVFVESNPSEPEESFETLLVKTSLGVSDWTEVPNGGTALDLVRFPLASGSTMSQGPFELNLGDDVDQDGVVETATANADSTVIGFEDTIVAGGTFRNAAKVEGQLSFSGTLSGDGSNFSGSGTVTQWFAPGAGEIRRDVQLEASTTAVTTTFTSTEELTDRVFLLADNIRRNDTRGAVPAAGGDHYIAVACNDQVAQKGLYAFLVRGSGYVPDNSFIGETHYLTQCQNENIAAAYDGNNYLVVFSKTDNAGNSNLVARHVRPDGHVQGSIVVSSSGGSAAVAFDGQNYLVVYNKFDSSNTPPGEVSPGHEIYGARITPNGVNLGEFAVFTSPGEQAFPNLAFDGTNYLVVWRDTRTGSGPTADTDIYGVRVSPSGVVLDDPAIAIVTAPRTQAEPHVASSGSNWLVVWNDIGQLHTSPPPDGRIFGRRVAPDGSVLDGAPDTDGIAIATAPVANSWANVAFVGNNYFAAWSVGSYPSHGT